VLRALVADQAVPNNLASAFDGTRFVVLLLQKFKHRLERVCLAPLGHRSLANNISYCIFTSAQQTMGTASDS
jgi:hypothetical protein